MVYIRLTYSVIYSILEPRETVALSVYIPLAIDKWDKKIGDLTRKKDV